jgi:hypothetical protein
VKTHRNDIKGVLHNFLGTYTSRYSDYNGYWLFGMLVGDVGELQMDLLRPSTAVAMAAPVATAIQLAAQKFREQVEKAGFTLSCVQQAALVITTLPEPRRGLVNGRMCSGHNVRFSATVVSDTGKTYESEMSVFIAPHDPEVELRSARST